MNEGFEWKEISGAGLKLMTQKNDKIKLMADPMLPGIVMVRNGDKSPQMKVKVFNLGEKGIDGLIDILAASENWDKSQTCMLKEQKPDIKGVHRYFMFPAGDYAVKMNELMKTEPVPVTCNGWGVGNSGYRYFETHDSDPGKVIFVEIGQDAPLFDPNSIEFISDTTAILSENILYTMTGTLCIGHEVRSFRPENEDSEYWIVDKTDSLNEKYDSLTGGQKNGKPVKAVLKLEYAGKWTDGFAAEYDGVYFVREIVSLEL